ncbi:helix-turn-helix domain-containing protein [Rhodoblastus acidophilus]|uniref:helix-turn-helix domain-containing protein n=1 Tax=Rhodoblastus acidophilus TaxID=1074 RepID=UPI000B51357E|nr:helix-turn-helix transcriptional regulator [Rhodoblastus acidophilus]MCW2318865.1 transcriptional regulator with XRE-family HTH domain [Rhodoblastus acidophilus]PPQ35766.1 XRE family transcriptional regulator [Rhodoblastus acidophilus]RAI19994.1 XRE family transcriptional regulator [Rhodoblastus acidophilus]
MVDNEIDVRIGANLRSLRIRNNLSLGMLAEVVGVTESRLLAFERGESRIGAALLSKMCSVLNVPPFAFFTWLSDQSASGHQLDAA